MVLGRSLSILELFAQQLPPRLNEVNGNFDRDPYCELQSIFPIELRNGESNGGKNGHDMETGITREILGIEISAICK